MTPNNQPEVFIKDDYATSEVNTYQHHEYKVVGQLWDSYIIVQHEHGLRYIDQHALAERIAFEKMKKAITQRDYTNTTLLAPVSIQLVGNIDSTLMSEQLNQLKFETTVRSNNILIIYKVPQFLVDYTIDIEKILRHLISEQGELLETQGSQLGLINILDSIFATRACKTSIKANHRLSLLEMQQLIKDGFEHIPGGFVCQHGRPFVLNIEKKEIDHMFDR